MILITIWNRHAYVCVVCRRRREISINYYYLFYLLVRDQCVLFVRRFVRFSDFYWIYFVEFIQYMYVISSQTLLHWYIYVCSCPIVHNFIFICLTQLLFYERRRSIQRDRCVYTICFVFFFLPLFAFSFYLCGGPCIDRDNIYSSRPLTINVNDFLSFVHSFVSF